MTRVVLRQLSKCENLDPTETCNQTNYVTHSHCKSLDSSLVEGETSEFCEGTLTERFYQTDDPLFYSVVHLLLTPWDRLSTLVEGLDLL